MRQGDWKLLYHHVGPRYELFNLADDLGERTNLADKHPKTRDRLAVKLGGFLESAGAQMPIDKKTGMPVPLPGQP